MLDVNGVRYFGGTPKSATRYIDTAWALAAFERARPLLPERSEVMQVHTDGRTLDARFHLERADGALSVVFHSRGGTGGSADERNTEYNAGLTAILQRLGELGLVVEDALVDSVKMQSKPPDERRIADDELTYPIEIRDADALRRALGRGMARVGRKQGAKGAGNSTKRVRLVLRGEVGSLQELSKRLSGRDAS